jgi:GNAT superfamily N-acetyltransferase
MSEDNKLVVRRFAGECWGQGAFEVADELVADEVVRNGQPVGRAGLVGVIAALHRLTSPPLAEILTGAGFDSELGGVVSRLMVDPAQRGRGLGMVLLDTATAAAHQRRLRPVLDVVTTYSSANQLYRRAGWQQIGVVSVAMPSGAMIDEYVHVGPPLPPPEVL